MWNVRRVVQIAAVAGLCTALAVPSAEAAKRKKAKAKSGYPYSIMTNEGGVRPMRAYEPWLATPHQSPLTPQGQAPTVSPVRPLGQPASPPAMVPGVSSNTGVTAVTPPRPAGQSFQDRTVNCVHTGGASGVGASQIGAYTRSCVNQ